MPELRCGGCGRLVGTTTRTQAVPVQCTDPFCAATPPISANEERDALMTHLVVVEQQPTAGVAELFGLTRQGAARAMAGR